MTPLWRLISWPYVRRHLVRSLLTVAGIMVGVCVWVGTRAANRGVLDAFADTVSRVAGKTDLEVTAGDAGFAEDVLEQVQAASTVRIAEPVVEAVVETGTPGRGPLLVLGVDMVGDRHLRDYDLKSGDQAVVEDPLVFLAQPDSLIVSEAFAEAAHLSVDDRLRLGTTAGARLFTVRGVMVSTGLASVFGGNLAVMDIYAAQKVFGRGRTFDRIDVAKRPDVTLDQCQAELRTLLGPGFDVEPPAGRGRAFEAMVGAYSRSVGYASLFALVIGMFIIYNAFAIAVVQRRSDVGILRALGATRRQIRQVFLVEGAVAGLLGSLLGLGLGIWMARAVAVAIGTVFTEVYGVAQPAEPLAVSAALLWLGLALGVLTSVVAAVVPAERAARLNPAEALQKGRSQLLSARTGRTRVAAAVLCGAVSAGCLVGAAFGGPLGRSNAVFYTGYVLVVIAALLFAPVAARALARAMRPALRTLRPVEGALAADSLIQSPRRTAFGVTPLMVSVALVVTFAGLGRASYDSVTDWIDTALTADLFVTPSPSVLARTVRFPETMGPELAAIPGVADVQMVRQARVTVQGAQVMVVATDIARLAQTARQRPLAGDASNMYRRTAAGEGVMISDILAHLHHLSLGDVVDIPAPAGDLKLPVVGIVVDYHDQQGVILLDRALFARYWQDDSVNSFRVYVTPGADVAAVRGRILDRFATTRQVFVLLNGQLRRYLLEITGQWFGLTYVQTAVATLVAILGIVNTLTVSIADRRQELGVLRAIGAHAAQIRRAIWIEAIGIGGIGLVLGCAFGAINLYYILHMVQHDIAGIRLPYDFPFRVALALVPTILGAAFLAAIGPARSALRGPLVDALSYE